MKNCFKYVYGPLYSWRLGMSLGIDPVSHKNKICNFDCIYCQLGKTARFTQERKEFVPTQAIVQEINTFPFSDIDYLTFSGRGEPTLAKNLGEMILALKKTRKEKVAVITNSSLLYREDVQEDLALADCVCAKLDACSQESFMSVDQAIGSGGFKIIQKGIKSFRQNFQGKLALQIMFIAQNKNLVKQIAKFSHEINPDEVQLNTPLRPSPVKPLTKSEMDRLKSFFQGMTVTSVYDSSRIEVQPLNEKDTRQRHGFYKEVVEAS